MEYVWHEYADKHYLLLIILNIGMSISTSPSLICGMSMQINIVSEYDQEIPKSQTAYKPIAPLRRATQ